MWMGIRRASERAIKTGKDKPGAEASHPYSSRKQGIL
jgi:hypothetical protein